MKEYPISIQDTGAIRTFNDTLPIEGWYEYSFTITDKSTYESARTPIRLLFGGPVQSLFSEHFDGDELRAYYTSGRFSSNSSFSFSKPNALTESPNGQYSRNARDTFMLMPVKTIPNSQHFMRFQHAAIIDKTDSALVEISQDWGKTWQILGQYDKTQFTPWMDSITNTDDWKPEIVSFTPVSDTSLFRFRFFSGPSFQEDGWWIDDISIGLTTGIAEIRPMDISVFPLPAKDFVTIGLELSGDIQLRVYDIMGNQIPSESLQFEHHDHYILIDVKQLPTGAYSLSLANDGKNIGTFPILIHK